MDEVSLRTMHQLIRKYLDPGRPTRILDVGSMDAQNGQYGTYKAFCTFSAWEYVGLDIEPGPNVDIVVKNPYNWNEIGHDSFDVVISGQCLEHVEFPWQTMECIEEVLKPGGLHLNIVPSTGPVHLFPIDTYRYLPDGMRALCKWAGLEVVEIQSRSDSIWQNTVLVARKPL